MAIIRFSTDTCFWMHARDLFDAEIFDMRQVLEQYQWGLTQEIIKEMHGFKLENYVNFDEAQIIPITNKDWILFKQRYGFSEIYSIVDQSLILTALRDSNVVLTDDGGLFMECLALQIQTFMLPLFILNQTEKKVITKKECYKCVRFWEERGLYEARQIKKWFKILQEI